MSFNFYMIRLKMSHIVGVSFCYVLDYNFHFREHVRTDLLSFKLAFILSICSVSFASVSEKYMLGVLEEKGKCAMYDAAGQFLDSIYYREVGERSGRNIHITHICLRCLDSFRMYRLLHMHMHILKMNFLDGEKEIRNPSYINGINNK